MVTSAVTAKANAKIKVTQLKESKGKVKKVEVIRYPNGDDWSRCLFLARITQGSEKFAVPSESWRRKLIASEHSPARTLMFTIALWNVPYFVSVHLVRHKFGVEH